MSAPALRKLGVVGASGRMGRAVVRLAVEGKLFEVAFAVGADAVGSDVGELAAVGRLGVQVAADVGGVGSGGVDCIIDFSAPSATERVAELAASCGAALVSGTTGLDEAGMRALATAAERVPVLWEPNMSVGVHVLGELVQQAVLLLGEEFDIEIVEAHHRQKVDAPSGTALRLAEAAQAARSTLHGRVEGLVHGRSGKPGARPRSEIGMHAVRGGDVIGDHSVHLLGDGERIELTHRASSRDLFARGALRAASWIAGKPAGRYRLADVVR